MHLRQGTVLVASYDTQGNGGRILPPVTVIACLKPLPLVNLKTTYAEASRKIKTIALLIAGTEEATETLLYPANELHCCRNFSLFVANEKNCRNSILQKWLPVHLLILSRQFPSVYEKKHNSVLFITRRKTFGTITLLWMGKCRYDGTKWTCPFAVPNQSENSVYTKIR